MFGLFTPTCPLELARKTWVEQRMLWFAERFGINRMRDARVVLPTDEFFPDVYNADHPSVRRCLDLICGYMGVDPQNITLVILPDEAMPNAAGWYEMRARSNICVARSQLVDPTRLMATLAHEVAHEILLGGGHLTGHEPDHEHTTDLLPAFLGVGIFAANGTLSESAWSAGMLSWTSVSVLGYLDSFVHGYALALFAHVRGERWPGWRKHLRADACRTVEKGLRFLQKTGDALFTPETVSRLTPAPTAAQLLDQLSARSPTIRLAALWDVLKFEGPDAQLLEALAPIMTDRDDTLRAYAVKAVGAFGPAALTLVPELITRLGDLSPGVRQAAAIAIGTLKPPAADVVVELSRLLLDKEVSAGGAWALSAYGHEATPALPNLLLALERTTASNADDTPVYFEALRAIATDPAQEIRAHLGERDPELLRLVLHEFKRHSSSDDAR